LSKKDSGIFIYKTLIPEKIKVSRRQLKNDIILKYDCRLQVSRGQWFLVVPYDKIEDKSPKPRDYCALDPGSRSFQTIYSEQEVVQMKHDKERIKKLQLKLDLMCSLRAKKMIRYSSYKRRERRLYRKMDHLIDDMHHKTIHYLTSTYNSIIIPPFESQEMVKKSRNRHLNRSLMGLKHYLFRSRLQQKCNSRGCMLTIGSEEYTSQTYGRCGMLTKVEHSDVYVCDNKECRLVIDRDVNGARNIFIKILSEKLS
jgi:putative transposase